MSVAGMLPLTEVRARAAAALAPADDGDPDVFADYLDAVHPPALILIWDDPWLEPGAQERTMGPCLWTPGSMVCASPAGSSPAPASTSSRSSSPTRSAGCRPTTTPGRPRRLQAPRVWTIANIPLLGARIGYRVPVTI